MSPSTQQNIRDRVLIDLDILIQLVNLMPVRVHFILNLCLEWVCCPSGLRAIIQQIYFGDWLDYVGQWGQFINNADQIDPKITI